jgi:hypothetical protein
MAHAPKIAQLLALIAQVEQRSSALLALKMMVLKPKSSRPTAINNSGTAQAVRYHLPFAPYFVVILMTMIIASTASAQQAARRSSLDNVGDDFFSTTKPTEASTVRETAGTDQFLDEAERPTPPTIKLPETLDEVAVVQSHDLSPEMQAWVRWLVLKNLPPVYEDNRKWGKTEEVYNGFRFRREGMKVETYSKYRTVKQGTWSRYFIEFIDPENELEIAIKDIRSIGETRLAFMVMVRTPLKLFGRLSQWQRDIQLISISTNADAQVMMQVDCECEFQINPLSFPPDVTFRPEAKSANVVIEQFQVHRISQISGPLAEQLGKGIRVVLDDKLADYNAKLVEKINRQLIKQQDKLTIKLQNRFTDSLNTWLK